MQPSPSEQTRAGTEIGYQLQRVGKKLLHRETKTEGSDVPTFHTRPSWVRRSVLDNSSVSATNRLSAMPGRSTG